MSFRNSEVERYFLRSYALFWPHDIANSSLKLIIDQEAFSSASHKNLQRVVDSFVPRILGGVSIMTNSPSGFYSKGYDRQQLLMFWADNFTNPETEYVAFCDTDTLFVTYVDKLDVFNSHNKPVVIGQIGLFKANTGWISGTVRLEILLEVLSISRLYKSIRNE